MRYSVAPGRPPQKGYHVTLNTARPKGYEQITVSSSAVGLTVPTDANFALIKVEGESIRWRDDGADPTSTVGFPLNPNDVVDFTHPDSLSQFKAIATGSDATLNVSYYQV